MQSPCSLTGRGTVLRHHLLAAPRRPRRLALYLEGLGQPRLLSPPRPRLPLLHLSLHLVLAPSMRKEGVRVPRGRCSWMLTSPAVARRGTPSGAAAGLRSLLLLLLGHRRPVGTWLLSISARPRTPLRRLLHSIWTCRAHPARPRDDDGVVVDLLDIATGLGRRRLRRLARLWLDSGGGVRCATQRCVVMLCPLHGLPGFVALAGCVLRVG